MGLTKIGWTWRALPDGRVVRGYTFNLWWGCAPVSPGCLNCYARTLDHRFGGGHWGIRAPRHLMSDAYWEAPLRWHRRALREGVRPFVFAASMGDVAEDRPDLVAPRLRFWLLALAAWQLDWLVLTKRVRDLQRLAPEDWRDGWPGHVWPGTSVEDQRRADERIRALAEIPAAERFLSCEPLLQRVNLARSPGWSSISWVICGGESGRGARRMDPDWARYIRDQCREAGIPFFFKQHGGRTPMANGRILDGRTWEEMPLMVMN